MTYTESNKRATQKWRENNRETYNTYNNNIVKEYRNQNDNREKLNKRRMELYYIKTGPERFLKEAKIFRMILF